MRRSSPSRSDSTTSPRSCSPRFGTTWPGYSFSRTRFGRSTDGGPAGEAARLGVTLLVAAAVGFLGLLWALPFVLGMALGLSIGRFLGGLVVGVPLGLVLFVAFGWLRLKLTELPQ